MDQALPDLRELLRGATKRHDGSEGHSVSNLRYGV
jgi:hypothetical protein